MQDSVLIVTLPIGENYGGILQAYALQSVISDLGYNVSTTAAVGGVGRCWKRSLKRVPGVKWLARIIKGNARNGRPEGYAEASKSFVKEYLKVVSFNEAKRNTGRYKAVIVGSDQVWREPYGALGVNFLGFVPKAVKKLSYAASFGVDNIAEYSLIQRLRARRAIKRFDAVSVREISGVAICSDFFGVEAMCHIDPTMIIGKRVYQQLADKGYNKDPGGICSYILDENEFSQSTLEAAKLHLNMASHVLLNQAALAPVEDWLRGFSDAEFIVTDSFHGTVFSIIFNKPFVTICNTVRGASRVESLLENAGLMDRLIRSESDLADFRFEESIDFAQANRWIETEQRASILYLQDVLDGIKTVR
ncbi:polysaccharide pyruvyl transferase family protein [Changpingibacter yushuensis]|uniref:polysaccharide pyruvyl transferase family protein n=1 Tax=Changpingibacter yushuensis TaxID=2758440 RepID=UPI0015F721FE|nr:polysaccharide pyruvyl transferase family protein [Changpingibacter yushuensis]